ncbi:hypothetical protein SNE40_002030 [Patella caerulea]|uniref:Uncharacterized protein n=1 Tax=Patella caerulea TaxID=87958 RepID=A0AAN8KB24_PATCE
MAEEEESKNENKSLLQRMLAAIKEERNRHRQKIEIIDDGGFEFVAVDRFWTDLFEEYFLESEGSEEDKRDDMLFYVRKTQQEKNKPSTLQPVIEVYRWVSKNKPSLDDGNIDWEETVYLNIILHQFEYTVTCAICTRTSDKDLQTLRKFSQRVYPSPSKREMSGKGTEEKITYPNIFFTVDNFEEAFQDIIIRDSESVVVELLARDKDGDFENVIFLGSVKYDALKKVYDGKLSLSSKMAQRMTMGWLQNNNKRVEFLRMRGPLGKGHAEMAVSRVKGSGPETPDIENFPSEDFDDSDSNQYTHRRMSDPSSGIGSFVRGGFRSLSMKKSRSETESVEVTNGVNCQEVEAGTIQDELVEDADQYNGFWGKSFGQAWHWFKEKRRASSVALNAYLTFITLPWHRIVADILESGQKPVLTH